MEFKVEKDRLVLKENGIPVSWIVYEADEESIHLIETHTAKGFEGKGFAGKVVEKALEYGKKFSKINISCPYIKHWIEKNNYRNDKVSYTELLKFKESIDIFNRYHEPEAKAEYKGYENGIVNVYFSGYMCRTCGVYDYFEDLIQDVNAKIIDYEEFDDGFLVKYRIGEK